MSWTMTEAETMSERTYAVGLVVWVTVDDDGTVSYEVDTSEAGAAMRELDQYGQEPPLDEEILEEDAQRVDADHDRRRAAYWLKSNGFDAASEEVVTQLGFYLGAEPLATDAEMREAVSDYLEEIS